MKNRHAYTLLEVNGAALLMKVGTHRGVQNAAVLDAMVSLLRMLPLVMFDV